MCSVGNVSRRDLLRTGTAVWFAAPVQAAVQAAGIRSSDLAIKEVKVYVTKPGSHSPPGNHGESQLAAIVTNNGIEGNYTLAKRYPHPNWSNLGWLDYAKSILPGMSALDLPALTSQWAPAKRRLGQLSYAAAIDNCLWDILGKAVNQPVYRLLEPTETACEHMRVLNTSRRCMSLSPTSSAPKTTASRRIRSILRGGPPIP
jgi:L-alanine-DL-glutamate epimerase-like enolase superfamily enzyme